MFGSHILTVILFTPLLGAILLLFIPRERADWYRWAGNIFGILGLLVSLPLLWRFRLSAGAPRFQFVSDHVWIPSLGVHYTLGIDGLSLLMVMLTTLLGAIAILAAWSAIGERQKEFYVLMLLLQTGLLGIFLSLDFVLFYVFWEATLVPIYFLIAGWGGERRLYAAIKFFLYTLAGSVVMLLAILVVYHFRGTFDMREILAHPFAGASPWPIEKWLYWGFFFAFAVKVPMFPFHTWLADAHTEAPAAASVILAGVVLKTGTYGFLRVSLPMFPDASLHYRGFLVALSIIAIIYGALVCLTQKDMKRLVAYSSVSQMGFCTLGIFALTPLGLSGSVIQQINHGISTGALFLIVGILYERRHTRRISDLGGLSAPMPNFAAIYLIVTLSSLGLPLLNGFIGEFSILRGASEVRWQWAAWGVLGIVLAAAYLLWLYQRVMFGAGDNPAIENSPDLNAREFATLIPLVLLIFWIGIYPKPLFRVLDAPVKQLIETVNPGYYSANVPADFRAANPAAPPATRAISGGGTAASPAAGVK